MKKKIFIIFVLVLVLEIIFSYDKNIVSVNYKKYYSPATDAGFESEELYRCVLDTLGKDKTSATDEELSQITEVICRSSNIDSAKGIEKLTSLRYLNLYDNIVSSIDLSKNTNLVMLNMTFNKLNNIDLSKNTNLQQLYLNGNNLNSIDLSKNVKLIDLNLYNNKLTSIDVTMLPQLKFLLLSLNNLKTIDLSNNNNLEHVYLSGNQLTNVKMPASAANLIRLDLNSNKLSNIDLSSLSNLKYLITSANELTNLDLSKNSELEYLYSSSNKINNIDLVNNVKLVDLDLYNNKLSNIDISKQNSLKYLNVSLNSLSNLDLSNNLNLEKIYASSNNLNDLSLDKQTNLKEINAVFNNFKGYNINNKDKITYMVIDYNWIKNMDFSAYTNLTKLEVDFYKKLTVSGDSTNISELLKYLPTNVSLNKYAVYKGFENIKDDTESFCKYDVNYSVAGSTATEKVTIDTCIDNRYSSNTLNSSINKIQIYSKDLNISGLNTNAALQFDGYYELTFKANQNNNTDQVVKVPNTSAVVSLVSLVVGAVGICSGLYLFLKKKEKRDYN